MINVTLYLEGFDASEDTTSLEQELNEILIKRDDMKEMIRPIQKGKEDELIGGLELNELLLLLLGEGALFSLITQISNWKEKNSIETKVKMKIHRKLINGSELEGEIEVTGKNTEKVISELRKTYRSIPGKHL